MRITTDLGGTEHALIDDYHYLGSVNDADIESKTTDCKLSGNPSVKKMDIVQQPKGTLMPYTYNKETLTRPLIVYICRSTPIQILKRARLTAMDTPTLSGSIIYILT
jgi:hypothetical protein